MESVIDYLKKWNKRTDSLGKIQGAYGVLAVAVFLIAGLVSLIQPNFGQVLAFYAIILALTFVANGVIWALIRTFVLPRLEDGKVAPTRKK